MKASWIGRIPSLLVLAVALSAAVQLAGCCGDETMKTSGELSSEEKTRALTAAEDWLALIDNGKYGESHDEAASYFRGAVAKEGWETQIKGVREPLGALGRREVKTTTYATALPGAPDGEYLVIQYDTSFANKANAVETVTPMREKDGSWRVSGYYIK